jgi:hypothetical protein
MTDQQTTATAPTPKQPKPVIVAFTGRLKVGKDHVAKALGAEIHGFADPIYALCRSLFGTCDKDLAGVRRSMQALAQWGRSVINDAYPLTPERGITSTLIRAHGEQFAPGFSVEWPKYGRDENLWRDALVRRLNASPAPVKAVTNIRFENELKMPVQHTHIHVMCSGPTYIERLKRAGMQPNDPALTDYSEQLAIALDKQVLDTVKREPKGAKLLCVWNDPVHAAPSPRFLNVEELKNYLNICDAKN